MDALFDIWDKNAFISFDWPTEYDVFIQPIAIYQTLHREVY